jgi:iron(III) transport system ATP-binding protein
MRLGDRVAVMRGGLLVQAGKAEELYHHPAALFVARLFSEINEIPYSVTGGAIDTPFGRLPAPGPDGSTAILCIRERGFRLRPAGQGLPGRVLHVKFLGDIGLVEIGVQGFDKPLRSRVRENEAPAKGSEVGVEVDRSRLLVFPAGSGESV